jgi:hypothetical protein
MDFLATQRASQNTNGGIYVNCAAYGREKRIEVADAYCTFDVNSQPGFRILKF